MTGSPHFGTADVGAPRLGEADPAALLAAIFDCSSDAIVGKTLEGVVTSWNIGAQRMFGYAPEEAMGRHVSFLVPPDHFGELTEIFARVARGERVELKETRRVCKDGSVLDVAVTISPILNPAGAIIGASAITRNITERLSIERERQLLLTRLNQSERLESMGRLAGGIAHDFNNMLAVILSYAGFVMKELDNKEKVKADVEQIQKAAERASELTRQLLAFARREVLQPKVLNLNDVIKDVEQLLRRTIGEHIELVTTLASEPWLVDADPGQIEQVLVNLAVNARDAMPEGGVLAIDTDNIQIDSGYADTHPGLAPGTYVRLRVSDTGSGMERSVLEKVFEPFFTTKPQGEGTGLGLPMVFGIVSQAGGEIQLYSEIGIGTTCRVLLPTTDRLQPVARPVEEPRNLGGTETILVVEDEDALREVTRRILAEQGYEVLTCANGPDAIELAEKHGRSIGLLLSDVVLPKMLGNEIASRVKELIPGLPVLYMSGYAQAVLGSTLGDGVSLLEKPFSEQQLLAKVRASIDELAAR